MSLIGFAISILLCALVLAWVLWPLLRRPAGDDALSLREEQRLLLLAEYERILLNIRDLDEDVATGKIPAEAHQRDRRAQVEEGVRRLRQIEALDTGYADADDIADEADKMPAQQAITQEGTE